MRRAALLEMKHWSRRQSTQRQRTIAWALVDQGAASSLTLLLTLATARALGADGLGVFATGLSAYLVVLGLNRAFLVEPLVVVTAPLLPSDRVEHDRCALSATALVAVMAAVFFLLASLVLPPDWRDGLTSFAPWLGFALLVDLWRTRLYRDGRPALSAFLSSTWLLIAAIAYLVMGDHDTLSPLVTAWGLGAVGATFLGAMLLPSSPEYPLATIRWIRGTSSRLGRWLTADAGSYAITSVLLVVVLASAIGATGLGSVRATQSLFTPLSVLAPLLTMVGLPPLSRAAALNPRRARRMAIWLSLGAVMISGAYFLIAIPSAERLLSWFHPSLGSFSNLAVPVGLTSLLAAFSIGNVILLKAMSWGRRLFAAHLIPQLAAPPLCLVLAQAHGAQGAAWGLMIVALLALLLEWLMIWRP